MTGHGGNIYRFAEKLGIPEAEIIDFSASINPLGVPGSVTAEIRKTMRYLYNYPDPDSQQLTAIIADQLDTDPASIICGNGSTELIYLVARALKPARVLIPAPTFSEYERAVSQDTDKKPGSVGYFRLHENNSFDIDPAEFIRAMEGNSSRIHPFDLAFLCNPNNPTGRLLGKDDMLEIAAAAKTLECYLAVDEAFIDFSPGDSLAGEVKRNPYLIVLRSMTKFYALSGLRLGYGVFPLSLVETVKKFKEPWTVNTLSQKAGIAALNDKRYADETFAVVSREKQFAEEGFKKLGISYVPSSVNYYLIRLDGAREIILLLRDKGILLRDCSNFRGLDGSYVRVAVKSRKHNALLMKELSRLCKGL